MNLIYQNQQSDRQAFYEYAVTQTPEGRRLQAGQFRLAQAMVGIWISLFGAVTWAVTGYWVSGLIVFVGMGLLVEGVLFVKGGFHPARAQALRIYKAQERSLTSRHFALFELPRTLTLEDQWLRVSCTEWEFRWRWRLVDRISMTSDFIFIHVDGRPQLYVPKRAFASEQEFKDFGARLEELRKAHENEDIGT